MTQLAALGGPGEVRHAADALVPLLLLRLGRADARVSQLSDG